MTRQKGSREKRRFAASAGLARQLPLTTSVAKMRTNEHDDAANYGGRSLRRKGWQSGTRQRPPSRTAQSWLVQSSIGRVLLHVLCFLQDGHLHWHWVGIRRELLKAENAPN